MKYNLYFIQNVYLTVLFIVLNRDMVVRRKNPKRTIRLPGDWMTRWVISCRSLPASWTSGRAIWGTRWGSLPRPRPGEILTSERWTVSLKKKKKNHQVICSTWCHRQFVRTLNRWTVRGAYTVFFFFLLFSLSRMDLVFMRESNFLSLW